jgi:hypothetical protein
MWQKGIVVNPHSMPASVVVLNSYLEQPVAGRMAAAR